MRELPTGNGTSLRLEQGDITKSRCDAIVNAANEHLHHGGGVALAIARAGGRTIQEESNRIGHCDTGSACITGGGHLPARYVIHAVGPIYRDGKHGEPDLLASAYRSSLDLADDRGLSTVAFPSISTGIYGYPIEDAAHIATATVVDFLATTPAHIRDVTFVLFGDADVRAYEQALEHQARARSLQP